jgi:hypothetical protein
MTKKICWTPLMLARFESVLEGRERDSCVTFDGNMYHVAYGRYLVEFLKGRFANVQPRVNIG